MSCAESLLATIDGRRVLDAGCGNGRSTRILADALGSFRTIVGIDPDKESLDEARQQTDDRRITYRQLSVSDLTPAPERFETCAISYALHHVPEPVGVLERLIALLVPRGLLIVTEPISDQPAPAQETSRDIHHFKAAIDRLKGVEHRETYRSDEIRALVKSAGGVVLEECCEQPPDTDSSEERSSWALKFLEGYLPFIEGQMGYPRLAEMKMNLETRICTVGVASPSHLFILATKA